MAKRPVAAFGFFCSVLLLASAQKKPLDHSVYDSWKSIRGTSLSHDGKWIVYVVAPQEGDSEAQVKSLNGGKTYTVARAGAIQFSNDSSFALATVVPALADTKKATRDKVAAADMPKNSLLILNLATGDQTSVERVTSFQLPAEDSGWFTYRPEPPKAEPRPELPAGSAGNTAPARPAAPRGGARGGARGAGRAGGVSSDSATGAPLVIRSLATGKEQRLENVGDASISKDGKVLAYTVVSKDGKDDGVFWMDLSTHIVKVASKGKAKVSRIALDDDTKDLAFLIDKASMGLAEGKKEAKPDYALANFQPKSEKVSWLAGADTKSFPKGWSISPNSALSFSDKGSRILFGTAPAAFEPKKDDTPDSDKVSVDIWNWKDSRIMPEQLLQAAAEQKRTYAAVVTIATGKVVQLETEAMPSATISQRGEGDFVLLSSDLNYRLESSWDADYRDYVLLNLRTEKSVDVAHKSEAVLGFSPEGKFLSGFDAKSRQYFTIDTKSLKQTDINVPANLFNELDDHPASPPSYGEAGWTKHDERLLVYDAYDIWSLDPTGKHAPMNLTGDTGRLSLVRLRYVNLDPEARSIDLNKPMLLSAFNTDSKAGGFYTLSRGDPAARPTKLLMEDKEFSAPIKAKNADTITYTRQDFIEFPNVWVADTSFHGARELSDANPQQAKYNWGTAETVSWISGDGDRLQGILIKPENFDYSKKYPMITYFYERMSDGFHGYHPPSPSASTINWSYFASNGYVVFIPDIPYRTGYPGESSMSAIVSGVLSIVNRGYVDPKRLGIQGHSWGGYEVAYLVTHTNLFCCAEAGAAVADMFSAYGGIRYGTGVLREGQYEHGQSRIGGTPWDKPLQYLENSPVFWLDKVQTPLLMMNNDKDGAVPFTQGIEMFSALRRLNKPAWMFVYNGEDHNLVERKNRKDWSIRLSQFFDHYMKGAPAPVWLTKGVPATMKGKTMGIDLEGN